MSSPFPEIKPNGSLILAWQVKNRHVLVVGGGEVAAGRIYHLLNSNAKVTVISPSINEEIEAREKAGLIYAIHRRNFQQSDLTMYQTNIEKPTLKDYTQEEYARMDQYLQQTRFEVVLVAIDDPVESKRIYYMAKSLGLNVNIADVPPLCDFYFGAMYRKGDLQIMVSTNGKGPRMAKLIKDKVGDIFADYEIDKTIENIGKLRKLLRSACSGGDLDSIKVRMDWMTKVTDMYSFKEWSQMGNTLEAVIAYFPDFPPSYEELKQYQAK